MGLESANVPGAMLPRALVSFQMGNSKEKLSDGLSKSKPDKKFKPTNLFNRLKENTGMPLKNRRRHQLSFAKQPANDKSTMEQLSKEINELRMSNNHLEIQVVDLGHERDNYLACFAYRLNEGIGRAERRKQQFDDFAVFRKRTCENGIFVFGARIHTQSQIDITLEILRRADPADSYLMEDIYELTCVQEHLEDEEYCSQVGREDPRAQNVDRLARRNEAVPREAWYVVRKLLVGERKAVLECLVRHGLYKDCSDETRARILYICIQFFDRRLSYQVWKMTLQELSDCPRLLIGGDIHTVEYQNINLVIDDCDEYNCGEWIRQGGTI